MLQSFKLAIKSIWGNKMRSFLTMLGIIIGVAAVIILVSLVNGYMGSVVESCKYDQSYIPYCRCRSDVCILR